MHRRAVIRAAIQSAVTGLATTGANVSIGRVYPETIPTLPALNIITGNEEIDAEEQILISPDSGKWPQDRRVEYDIEMRAAGASLDDTLDQIALEVETALNADAKLGGECDKIEYVGSEASELSGEVEEPIGLRTLSYLVHYRVDARDPQALED